MFFPSKQGERIAQRRLKKLVEKSKLKRDRLALATPYYYYTDRIKQIEHTLNINWIYVWLKSKLKNWESLYTFDLEQDYGILRCDGFTTIKNTVTGELKCYFIEMDQAESSNVFKKVKLYNDLFESDHKVWWKNLAKYYPTIIIVTTDKKQLEVINEKIKKENRNDLDFRVYLLDNLKGDINGYI